MKVLICILITITLLQIVPIDSNYSGALVNAWANKIGEKLWKLSHNLTNNLELKAEYSNVNVTELNVREMLIDMTNQVKNMLDSKKYALRRIVDNAEQYAINMTDKLNDTERSTFQFRDAKNLNETEQSQLNPNVNFFNVSVSTEFSTVHVPDDVYNRTNETFLGIKWSEILDPIFQHNYAIDPTLSWQYFAGVSGFMRVYPGLKWDVEEGKADLFDARSRPWYVEAATDPKDIVILVDNSGSMMGQKKEIARHTINTILETLGPNDFVNIIQFYNTVTPVVECFNNNLVQANLVTIRELKVGVENMSKATNLANFSEAIIRAFAILKEHRDNHLASMCNQAIMLITDGAPDSYTNIFQTYNWGNSTTGPDVPFSVRVFTYLIGRNGADSRETKWMACANKGYYVQLNTIPEVKEQVFHYINVLARPLVLKKSKKIAWTSLYAHQVDPKIMDRYWMEEQNKQQRAYSIMYRENWDMFLRPEEQMKRLKERRKAELDQNKNYGYDKYNFMITISHPAYDQRTTKNITENILVNEAYWTQRVYEANVASLLGVAATDVPISEFRKIMKPHYLGVNNYGFIVNNNGYIITHPDLRPIFKETLKPGYNTVDMLEAELLDADPNKDPRDFGIQVLMTIHGEPIYSLSNLSLLRDYIINQSDYTNSYAVKYHYDNMRRASTGIRNYSVRKIEDSPFTMVLALMKQPCKAHGTCFPGRVVVPNYEEKLSRERIRQLFSGGWTIHPEWLYCKYNYMNDFYKNYSDNAITNKTTELLHFLNKMIDDALLKESRNPYADLTEKVAKKAGNDLLLSYFCDKELMRNIIYDANITKNYFQHLKDGVDSFSEFNVNVSNVFIATHSGLTRWKNFRTNSTPFGYIYNRTIDEIWYKRAIEQHYFDEKSFVFSIPTNEDVGSNMTVTATHAIFVKEKKKSKIEGILEAPVAVVGYQFDHADFEKLVHDAIKEVSKSNEEVNYVVLDNNGYIMASNKNGHSGKFFGTIQSNMMKRFKECKIYKQIVVYDYQGVCFENFQTSTNNAIKLFANPLKQLKNFIIWSMSTVIWGIIQIQVEMMLLATKISFKCDDDIQLLSEGAFESIDDVPVLEEKLSPLLNKTFEYYNATALENEGPKYSLIKHLVMINRTRPQTCDRKTILYQLEPENRWDIKSPNCTDVLSSIKMIPYSNLLFVHLKNEFDETEINYEYFSTYPVKVKPKFFSSPVCYKVNAVLSRRRPSSCCKHDKDEKKIKLCGSGNTFTINIIHLLVAVLISSNYF